MSASTGSSLSVTTAREATAPGYAGTLQRRQNQPTGEDMPAAGQGEGWFQ